MSCAELQFAPLTRQGCGDWDAFCAASDDAWFFHTSAWLEYTLAYRPEWRPESHCFFVMQGDRVLAICPLMAERRTFGGRQVIEFGYGGEPCPMPALAPGLSDSVRKSILNAVFARVDAIAAEAGAERVSFRSWPLAPGRWKAAPGQVNPLLYFGFSDISLPSQVIEVQQSDADLLRQMRHGHRSDIKRAATMLQAQVYDAGNITDEVFTAYRLLHHKAAGRVTRPPETFALMLQWIREGSAALACARHDGIAVGFSLALCYKDGAYYGSSCNDPECDQLPIGHLLQWQTMRWLRDRGSRHYETGQQVYAPLPYAPASAKEINISLFKRGFGGRPVAAWTGEKFYSRAYYDEVMEQRSRAYRESIPGIAERAGGAR